MKCSWCALVVFLGAATDAQVIRTIDAGIENVPIMSDAVLPWDAGFQYCDQLDTIWVLGGPVGMSALFHFDLSAIPPGTRVTGTSLGLVSFAGLDPVALHVVRRPWTRQVTWLEATSSVGWQAPGATGVADVDPNAFLTAPLSSGLDFSDGGLSAVQSWVDSPASNTGFLMRSASTRMYDAFRSNTFANGQPVLRVLGVLPDGGALDERYSQGRFPTSAYAGAVVCQMAGGPALSAANWREFLLRLRGDARVLLGADVTAIPPWATPVAARWRVPVRNPGTMPGDLREVLRPWQPFEATWNRASAASVWAAPGLQLGVDKGNVIIASAPVDFGFAPEFNDAGLGMLQRWVSQPSSNLGVILESGNPSLAIASNLLSTRLSQPGEGPALIVEFFEGRLVTPFALDLDGGPQAFVLSRTRLDGTPLPGGVGPLTARGTLVGPLAFELDDGGRGSTIDRQFAAGAQTADQPLSVVSLDGGAGFVFVNGGLAWLQAKSEVRVAGQAPPLLDDGGFVNDAGSDADAGSTSTDAGDGRPVSSAFVVGCGCAQTGAGGWWLFVIAALLVAQRRSCAP
ncbi:MAG: DNRLRE domain-containing protein [Myxococcales bacterium]|nr:DNRLRE domain-containing protein [Myxococcales bacterium]MDP3501352.1 DNRLRE domain-containing protein [Myxococcales bacterium]